MEALLTSEKYIKENFNISDNVAGKFIGPSIREAQREWLRGILGSCLYDTLCGMVADQTIKDETNAAYKALLDEAQLGLGYATIVELCPKVNYKIGNFGVAQSSDENLRPVGADELSRQVFYYQSKADAAAFDLQGWLLERRAAYPELRECDCARIKSNLYSAASCGLWLGGPRGRILPKGGCCK